MYPEGVDVQLTSVLGRGQTQSRNSCEVIHV